MARRYTSHVVSLHVCLYAATEVLASGCCGVALRNSRCTRQVRPQARAVAQDLVIAVVDAWVAATELQAWNAHSAGCEQSARRQLQKV